MRFALELKFTPLEFETVFLIHLVRAVKELKFTPLEFETLFKKGSREITIVKIYSVGV